MVDKQSSPEPKRIIADNLKVMRVGSDCTRRILESPGEGCRLATDSLQGVNLLVEGAPVYKGDHVVQQAAAEAHALLDGREPRLIAFFGYGLGLHLNFLRRLTRAPILVFEPSADVAAHVLARVSVDLPDVHLAVTRDGFAECLGKVLGPGAPDIVAGAVPAYRELFPEAFTAFREVLDRQVHNRRLDMLTRTRFSAEWVDNLAANLPHLARQKPLAALGQVLAGRPALFVGAGPSLDANLPELARAKGRVLLVAAHTAVIPLSKSGIVPDLVVITEGQKLDHYFADISRLNEMILVPSPQTHPIHLTLGFRDIAGVSLEGNASADWLERAFGEHPLPNGGSVACAAFSVMKQLGCNPLICVGMDLSFVDGRSHAAGTEFGCCRVQVDTEAGVSHVSCPAGVHPERDFVTTMSEAWGGRGQVAARRQLASFRYWFEDAARTWLKSVELINANGSGARIRGWQEERLAEVLDRCPPNSSPVGEEFAEALSRVTPRDPALLREAVRTELSVIASAAEVAESAEKLAGQGVARLQQGRLQKVQPVLDELAVQEEKLGRLTRKTRLLNTLVGVRSDQVATEKASGDKVARTIHSLRQSQRISRLVQEGAGELLARFEPVLEDVE